jgi:predicted RNA polymerase sigma factor
VLATVHLLFTTGHTAPSGGSLVRADLVERPSPVVALNRAVPLSMTAGPGAALAEVERLEGDPRLAGYHYLPAAKADLLRRLGRDTEAAGAYRQAFALTANEAERAFLAGQLATGDLTASA